MLPEKGPWPHPYYAIDDSFVVWMEDVSHFLHVDAPERTVQQIVDFDR